LAIADWRLHAQMTGAAYAEEGGGLNNRFENFVGVSKVADRYAGVDEITNFAGKSC